MMPSAPAAPRAADTILDDIAALGHALQDPHLDDANRAGIKALIGQLGVELRDSWRSPRAPRTTTND